MLGVDETIDGDGGKRLIGRRGEDAPDVALAGVGSERTRGVGLDFSDGMANVVGEEIAIFEVGRGIGWLAGVAACAVFREYLSSALQQRGVAGKVLLQLQFQRYEGSEERFKAAHLRFGRRPRRVADRVGLSGIGWNEWLLRNRAIDGVVQRGPISRHRHHPRVHHQPAPDLRAVKA